MKNGLCAFWRVPEGLSGSLYPSLAIQCGTSGGEEYLDDTNVLLLNGIPVVFDTATGPEKIPDGFLCELRAIRPITVAPGDELRLSRSSERRGQRVGALRLDSKPQEPGVLPLGKWTPANLFADVARLDVTLFPPEPAGASGKTALTATNMTGKALAVSIKARILDYFQVTLAAETFDITLPPHGTKRVELTFPKADTDRYRCVADLFGGKDIAVHCEAEELVDQAGAFRSKMWLNTGWERTSSDTAVVTTPPQDATWIKTSLPDTLGRDSKDNIGWWRKTFTPPEWLKGGTCVARFQRALYEATIYLNGQKIACNLGPMAPFEVDLSTILRWGQPNELLVVVRNGMAALPESEQRKEKPTLNENSEVLGPGAGRDVQLWEICLTKEPAARVTDIFVKPHFRSGTLQADVVAEGLPDGDYSLSGGVVFAGTHVLDLPPLHATASNGVLKASLKEPWTDPPLWSLNHPNLLRLRLLLKNEAGKVIDDVSTRFGFREIWTAGGKLLLNGAPIKLRGFAMESSWNMKERMRRGHIRDRLNLVLRNGGQFQRHAYDPTAAEICDEIGLPIACGVAGISHPTVQKIESDQFWATAERDVDASVRRLRNNPSILEWYISNEFVETSPESVTPLAVKRDRHLADTATAADDTRIVEAGCDLDLRGHLKVISTHYPVDIHALRIPNAYLPLSRLWRMPDKEFAIGGMVPSGQSKRVANVRGDSPIVWGVKPIMVNENGWIFFFSPPRGLVEIGGESVYASPSGTMNAFFEAHRLFSQGHRDAEVSLITPWNHPSQWDMRRGLPSCDIVPLTSHSAWFAGAKTSYSVNIHHDLPEPHECELAWGVAIDGKTTDSGKLPLALTPYELKRLDIAFSIPPVDRPTNATLTFTLNDQGGARLAEATMPGTVVPRTRLTMPRRMRVALHDPAGKTRPQLAAAGLDLPPQIFNTAGFEELDLLIIGDNGAGDKTLTKNADAIRSFLEKGGRLLILHQNDPLPPELTAGVSLVPASGVVRSHALVRMNSHPLAGKFDENLLKWWAPDYHVTTSPFVKPSTGSPRTLVDTSDGKAGIEFSVLVEIPVDKGRILASQFDLIETLDSSPNARLVLQAILDDLSDPRPHTAKTTALLAERTGNLAQKLDALGAVVDSNPTFDKLGSYQALVIEGSKKLDEKELDAVGKFVEDGGTVLVHGATADAAERFAKWFGPAAKGCAPDVPAWRARAVRTAASPLLDGLSSQDFFWKRLSEGEDMRDYFHNARFDIDTVCDWLWDIPGAVPQLYPPAVLIVKKGKGTWILDNLRWDAAAKPLASKADRVACQLLANVGVAIKGKAAVRKLLENLDYAPVDLRGVLNRPLIDDVDDDGKGGWTDQGPGSDLRSFKPGRHVFNGVPFEIPADKSCLVMASQFRKADNPASATIKINRAAKALYFLQTSAWTSAVQLGSYVVEYADGTSAEIVLEGTSNLRDWTGGDPKASFFNENDTYTQWAWSGTAQERPVVSLFMMQWVNPKSEKVIKNVIVQSQKKGIIVLMGLTLGVDGTSGAISKESLAVEEKHDLAMKFYEEAVEQLEKKELATAERLLRSSLAAAPSHLPTRLRLASVLVELQKVDDAEVLLKETLTRAPDTLEAYHLLGRLYESQKRFDDARALYRKSLEVEPNQPLAVQALERLGK